ncbi:CAAX prenyl protease [Malassezia sp. CBS 17886]|nr:CAAX prenyl protease [Malassezia sp. CBS 17886]
MNLCASLWACAGYTVVYVGSLYVMPRMCRWLRGRPQIKPRARDDPAQIRERLWSAAAGTGLDLCCAFAFLNARITQTAPPNGSYTLRHPLFRALQILHCFGLPLPTPTFLTSNWLPLNPSLPAFTARIALAIGGAVVLTGCVYAGTLYLDFCEGGLPWQHRGASSQLMRLRNYVIGPVSEELVFRSCTLATLQYGGDVKASGTLIFASPLFFGIGACGSAMY